MVLERFSDEATSAVAGANEQARLLDHGYFGTEHLLLALLNGDSVAATVLGRSGITYAGAREQVVQIIGLGEKPHVGRLPATPRMSAVVSLSLDEAHRLGHDWVGAGHLLLAILTHGEGIANRVLDELGGEPDQIREWVTRAMTDQPPPPPTAKA